MSWPVGIGAPSVVTEVDRRNVRSLEIKENFTRGVAARRGHHAAAGVAARAAQVQAAEWAAILRIAGNRPVEHELIHRQLAVEDVAFGHADLFLDHCRRADLDMLDQALEIGAVFGDLIDDRLAELLLLLIGPVAALDLRRAVLDETTHEVFTGRRHCRVAESGYERIDIGVLRPGSVLPIVVGAFQAFHRVDEVHVALEQRTALGR